MLKKKKILTPAPPISVYQNCKYCVYYDECPKCPDCEYLSPAPCPDEQVVCDQIIDSFKGKNQTRSQRKSLPHKVFTMNSRGDGITPLYNYYCDIVNNCLSSIHAGGCGYLFRYNQIKALLELEPNVNIKISDGIFYVTSMEQK